MADRDYYEVLGVPRNATRDEVRKAYRQLAREWHPDLHPGDEAANERFKEINEAYRVLSDDEQRRRYDTFGSAEGDGVVMDPFEGFGDIFDMFFGGRGAGSRRRSAVVHGGDIHLHVSIELKDVLTGVRRELSFDRLVECSECRSTGLKPGTQPETCPQCGGAGRVMRQQSTFFGATVVNTTCNVCQGEGRIIRERCAKCRGRGLVERAVTHRVDIPKGIEDGGTLQIPGSGHDGLRGGRPGDLFVTVRVRPDPRFERRGPELYTLRELSFPDLALGATITVDTLEGEEEVDVPSGTQHRADLIVPRKGLPAFGSERRGDLHVIVDLTVPTHLTKRQKELLQEFAAEGGKPAKPKPRKRKSYFDKFKESMRGDS